ncbi:hypothetical protein ACK3SF_05295 [Candidatus Nanosalina sp. VS9-1]|uniref:hypothetical protein n=1 Tax=Candidatus Nanosalina sp. VS9-1 TaxID=3388566 RepID=UPI0039E0E191
MGLWKKVKQYGNLLIALMMAVGFGATFMIYAGGAPGGSTGNDDTQQLNYELPNSTYSETGFQKNYREQVVSAAQNDIAYVNVIYDNESQLENIEDMRPVASNFNNRAYVQVIPLSESEDLPSQTRIEDYPSAVVVGGSASQRGVIPRQEIISGDITQTEVETAVCNALSQLQGVAARCQSLGAL